MSKADGKVIAIRFDNPLTGDVGGLTPVPAGYVLTKINPAAVTASSQYSSTYAPAKAADGDISTYWYPSAPAGAYITEQLPVAFAAVKMRLYIGNSTYYPLAFTVSGSGDGTVFMEIYSGTSTSGVGWKEFSFANTVYYLYYRLTVSTYNSTRFYIHELEFYYSRPVGNEIAFTVTGQQYNYMPEGILIEGDYSVQSVGAHPTLENTILLTLGDFKRFHNAVGILTVAYDKTKGNLAGQGGAVESFVVSFTPEDLLPKPNPHGPERIDTSAQASGNLIRIYYTDTYYDGRIEIGIAVSGVLINVNDI